MARKRSAKQTRTLIFKTCSQILQCDGLACLTLDTVAEQAGLSKGGLLYHFPNKAALIEALFEYHNEQFERRLQELTAAEGTDPGAWLRAYAKASIEQIIDPDNASLYASLFAAEERYASAHQLMRDKYVRWQQKIEESGMDPARATLIRLAVDGLWFAEMHRYAPPDVARREEVVQLILQLTEEVVLEAG